MAELNLKGDSTQNKGFMVWLSRDEWRKERVHTNNVQSVLSHRMAALAC